MPNESVSSINNDLLETEQSQALPQNDWQPKFNEQMSRRNFLMRSAEVAGVAVAATSLYSAARFANYLGSVSPEEAKNALSGEIISIAGDTLDFIFIEKLDKEEVSKYEQARLTFTNIGELGSFEEHLHFFASEPGSIPVLDSNHIQEEYSTEIKREMRKYGDKYTGEEIVRRYGIYMFDKLIDEGKMKICYVKDGEYYAGNTRMYRNKAFGAFGHLAGQVKVENGVVRDFFAKSRSEKKSTQLDLVVEKTAIGDGDVSILTNQTRYALPHELADMRVSDREKVYEKLGLRHDDNTSWEDLDWRFLFDVTDPEVKKLFGPSLES